MSIRAILWPSILAAIFVAVLIGLLTHDVKAGAGPSFQEAEARQALAGVIDIHAHSLPDMQPRSIDAIDLAKLAQSRGMRGLVLKSHYDQTAGLAFIVRKVVPGIEVFGGIDLNRTHGGINVAAVEHMTQVTGGWGRVVWMPTHDSEYGARNSTDNRPFVAISRNGQLLPEVKEVISLVAKHGLALATGHSSAEESVILVQEAQMQGVPHVVITHALNQGMSIAQMQEVAKRGAYIEFIYGHILTNLSIGRRARYTPSHLAEIIREVGPEHSILSTDLGQAGNPLPPDGLGAFVAAMRAEGFSERELDRMTKENPANWLGLPLR